MAKRKVYNFVWGPKGLVKRPGPSKLTADETNPKDLLGIKKAPLRLVPPALVIFTSPAMMVGATKYGEFNWRSKKVRYSIYLEAAMRHILALMDGEDTDTETGAPHEGSVAACMAILLDARITGNLIDDRPVKGGAALALEQVARILRDKGFYEHLRPKK